VGWTLGVQLLLFTSLQTLIMGRRCRVYVPRRSIKREGRYSVYKPTQRAVECVSFDMSSVTACCTTLIVISCRP